MSTIGIIAAIGAAVVLLKKRKTSAVGRLPKRRIFTEIADAQAAGIDLSSGYSPDYDSTLRYLMNKANYKPSERSAKSPEEQYYNSLYRAYRKIPAIGALPLLNKSTVKNERGDIVLEYYDYGTPEQQYSKAQNLVEELYMTSNNPYNIGYWGTLLGIASGKKILWKSRYNGGQLIKRGADAILHSSNEERKQRISYLGNDAKGALSLDMIAHNLWQMYNNEYGLDDTEIYNGVESAVLECTSVKDARNKILDVYISYKTPEEEYYGGMDENLKPF